MSSNRKAEQTKREGRKEPASPVKRRARRGASEELSPERRAEIALEIKAREFRGKPPSI
jgi:hypothetical protein